MSLWWDKMMFPVSLYFVRLCLRRGLEFPILGVGLSRSANKKKDTTVIIRTTDGSSESQLIVWKDIKPTDWEHIRF